MSETESRERRLKMLRTVNQHATPARWEDVGFLLAELDRVTAERDEMKERYECLSTDFAEASVRWKTYANERDTAIASRNAWAERAEGLKAALEQLKRSADGDSCVSCGSDQDVCWPDCIVGTALGMTTVDSAKLAGQERRTEGPEGGGGVAPDDGLVDREELDRMRAEGEEIRKEIARRVEPMKRGPWEPKP